MSDEQRAAPEQGAAPERHKYCDAGEVISHLARAFGASEEAQQHFRQSRIELLKGIRKILDDRIEHISRAAPRKGTRIVVD
jgi:hypothetical protein